MLTITTTQLRVNTKQLVEKMLEGKALIIIHRSKVIGRIMPDTNMHEEEAPPIDIVSFKKYLASNKPKKLIQRKDRESIYRKHLVKKYGTPVS